MLEIGRNFLRKTFRYQLVNKSTDEVDDEESALSPTPSSSSSLKGSGGDSKGTQKPRSPPLYLAFSLISLFISVSFLLYKYRSLVSDERCMRRMSAPSPVLDAVKFQWGVFNDALEPDAYSGYPSAASEKAWAQLWDFGAFGVPLDLLSGLNKSSATGDFRLVDEKEGGGVGGLLEGAHQIHCLNLVRQFIYKDHWDYSQLPSFSGGNKTRRHHVDHCIETLRKVVTCLSDVTPYVMVKSEADGRVQGRGLPHKCRVYPDMVNWVNSHSVFDTIG